MEEIELALTGHYGDDQRQIAEEGLALILLLLAKNRDYGGSAWSSPLLCPSLPPSVAIRVRMSDKIARLVSLDARGPSVDESVKDTLRDLAGYCLLELARP